MCQQQDYTFELRPQLKESQGGSRQIFKGTLIMTVMVLMHLKSKDMNKEMVNEHVPSNLIGVMAFV